MVQRTETWKLECRRLSTDSENAIDGSPLSPATLYINIMAKRRRETVGGGGGEGGGEGAQGGEETGISGWLVTGPRYTRAVRSVARVQDHNAISTVGSNCRRRERAYFA